MKLDLNEIYGFTKTNRQTLKAIWMVCKRLDFGFIVNIDAIAKQAVSEAMETYSPSQAGGIAVRLALEHLKDSAKYNCDKGLRIKVSAFKGGSADGDNAWYMFEMYIDEQIDGRWSYKCRNYYDNKDHPITDAKCRKEIIHIIKSHKK